MEFVRFSFSLNLRLVLPRIVYCRCDYSLEYFLISSLYHSDSDFIPDCDSAILSNLTSSTDTTILLIYYLISFNFQIIYIFDNKITRSEFVKIVDNLYLVSIKLRIEIKRYITI